jgi:hypothetical protein
MKKMGTLEDIVEPKTRPAGAHFRFVSLLVAGVAACLFGPATARADIVISVQSVTAVAGSSGNGIDVDLTNSGPSSMTIGGFSFGISIANPAISFTDANTATAVSYIFGGNSLFGPDLTGPTSGQTLSASDLFSIPLAGVTLSAGSTVGLGHVLFDVAPGAASGFFPVNLTPFPTTSLSDAFGSDLPVSTLLGGSITIPSAVVPEPSSTLPLVFGGALLWTAIRRRRGGRGLPRAPR